MIWEVQDEEHAVFRCQLAPIAVLREEASFSETFDCVQDGDDLHQFINQDNVVAVASSIYQFLLLCEGAMSEPFLILI